MLQLSGGREEGREGGRKGGRREGKKSTLFWLCSSVWFRVIFNSLHFHTWLSCMLQQYDGTSVHCFMTTYVYIASNRLMLSLQITPGILNKFKSLAFSSFAPMTLLHMPKHLSTVSIRNVCPPFPTPKFIYRWIRCNVRRTATEIKAGLSVMQSWGNSYEVFTETRILYVWHRVVWKKLADVTDIYAASSVAWWWREQDLLNASGNTSVNTWRHILEEKSWQRHQ